MNGSQGEYDLFIRSIDPESGELNWSKSLGSKYINYWGQDLKTDTQGNIVVAGMKGTTSISFNLNLIKYDYSGNKLWEKTSNSKVHEIKSIDLDSVGNIYIGGISASTDYEGESNNGSLDGLLTKFNKNGGYQWSRLIGTSFEDRVADLTVDSNDKVVLVGMTYGKLGDSTVGNTGWGDAYVAKYDGNGNQIWLKQYGTTDNDFSLSLVLDNENNIFIAGLVEGNRGTGKTISEESVGFGMMHAFVTKFTTNGDKKWIKHFGTESETDYGSDIDINSENKIFLVGQTQSNLDNATFLVSETSTANTFITQWSEDGVIQSTQNSINNHTVATGGNLTCVITEFGSIKCIGSNGGGALGYGSNGSETVGKPVYVKGINDALKMSAWSRTSCAILMDGKVKCWGENLYGQAGDGTNDSRKNSPVFVSGLTHATDISTQGFHSCAVLQDGSVKCWGKGGDGQLGNGGTNSENQPKKVTGIDNAIQVSVGDVHSCALLRDRTVKCWGLQSNGALGNGLSNYSSQNSPVPVINLSNVIKISSGVYHNCALINDGTIKCWGQGGAGQLGNGFKNDQTEPVQVTGIDSAVDISLGGNHSCALLDDNTIKCWGLNQKGQIGNGNKDVQHTPATVNSIDNAISISAKSENTCALLKTEAVKCWGDSIMKQMGDSITSDQTTPALVTEFNTTVPVMDVGGSSGFVISDLSDNTTSESGDNVTFTIRLSSQPSADVTFNITSSDETEGTVYPTSMTFSSTDWFINKLISVHGVDDNEFDDNQSYSILLGAVTSSDADYNGLDPSDLSVINIDNEVNVDEFKLPDTGQTESYTNTFGEDSDYTINPPSYTDNGDGTVTDRMRGLIWQREDDNLARGWNEAVSYCDGLSLAGHGDWRLPVPSELMSIVDFGTYEPMIFGSFFTNILFPYWSSVSFVGNTNLAWDVDLGAGVVARLTHKDYGRYARCVRGTQTQVHSFTDHGDGTVTDLRTGLMWQKHLSNSPSGGIWVDALNACEDSAHAGYDDWRLPNIRELESLVDASRALASPAVDTDVFPYTQKWYYWSSTTYVGNTSEAWSIEFRYGDVGNRGKEIGGYVRCVR